ncbi:protein twisted gastrulation [Periplaneta americana]|uniref:protein twisted gastrulation n=1 Tax=Periplaneta americana TaxID=6978 RepID=UPI0037E94D75
MLRLASIFVAALAALYLADVATSCNEAVCASVVSKCMLTQSCKCDLKNCSCCNECFSCLGDLFSECCSCVDMCPKPNDTSTPLGKKSHVEDFNDPIPALFDALTAEPDTQQRWITYKFPVDYDQTTFLPKQERDNFLNSNIITFNCTVAYMSQCMSWNKCKQSCKSTGAVSYRWFHDGCCECVGSTCFKYGINESRCLNCPVKREEDEDDSSYLYDYEDYDNTDKGDLSKTN